MTPLTDQERTRRFWARVHKTESCWLWTGSQSAGGYGRMRWPGLPHAMCAHRISYLLSVGPIPEGMEIDHLCFNPRCVRPDHLEPVTSKENVRRARVVNPVKNPQFGKCELCKRGHDLAANAMAIPGGRRCRLCFRASMRLQARRKRGSKKFYPSASDEATRLLLAEKKEDGCVF